MKFWMNISLTLLLVACSTSPTGRHTVKLVSSDQLNQMGLESFQQLKQQLTESNDQQTNRYVKCIANRITPLVPKGIYQGSWEVVVFESEQANAFALPGGKIGVYTGLLKFAKNQHQLATVIGHEIAHVIAEHGNERVSSDLLVSTGLQITEGLLRSHGVEHKQQVMAALGVGSQVLVTLPFSRTHESEADQIGLELMAKAGFDPRQAVNLWQNMAKKSDKRIPEFMSTHPVPETRIAQLKQLIPLQVSHFQLSNAANCGLPL